MRSLISSMGLIALGALRQQNVADAALLQMYSLADSSCQFMAYQVHVFMGVCSAQTNDEAISLTEANGASYKVKLFNVAAGAQPSCTTSNLQWTYELSASGSCAPFNIIDSSGRGVVYGYGRIIVDASNPITPPNAGVYNVLRYQGSGCASYDTEGTWTTLPAIPCSQARFKQSSSNQYLFNTVNNGGANAGTMNVNAYLTGSACTGSPLLTYPTVPITPPAAGTCVNAINYNPQATYGRSLLVAPAATLSAQTMSATAPDTVAAAIGTAIGTIVGIAVGCVCACCACIIVIILIVKRSNKATNGAQQPKQVVMMAGTAGALAMYAPAAGGTVIQMTPTNGQPQIVQVQAQAQPQLQVQQVAAPVGIVQKEDPTTVAVPAGSHAVGPIGQSASV